MNLDLSVGATKLAELVLEYLAWYAVSGSPMERSLAEETMKLFDNAT